MSNLMEQRQSTSVMGVEQAREVAEIQAKIYLSRQFPREEEYCMVRILKACENPKLAELAQYSYPKGGQEVKGASIRLIETIAQHWGNFLSGVKELSRTESGATMKVFAWDLESNSADEKVFDVAFVRNTKNGSYMVTDEREKYEMTANYGARRKRACIQAIIPAHVIDAALEKCTATLEASLKGKDKSIEEVRDEMVAAFVRLADWITPEMLATVAGKDFDKLTTKDIVRLRNLHNAIRDGFVKAEVAFGQEKEGAPMPGADEDAATDALTQRVKGK